MLRILELSWLAVAIVCAGLSIYKWNVDGSSEALFFVVVTVVALLMFLVRRKQRIKLDKYKQQGPE